MYFISSEIGLVGKTIEAIYPCDRYDMLFIRTTDQGLATFYLSESNGWEMYYGENMRRRLNGSDASGDVEFLTHLFEVRILTVQEYEYYKGKMESNTGEYTWRKREAEKEQRRKAYLKLKEEFEGEE